MPDSMDCPLCAHPMQEGRIEVSGMYRPAIPRADTSDLWWFNREPSRRNKELLIEDRTARLAFGCAECDLVTFFTVPELQASWGRALPDEA